jgi:D-alanyl-D-alanine carboxypeptidase/D-alanyl-D-alanine-endopeptidase (penicillin-binding protein 4)
MKTTRSGEESQGFERARQRVKAGSPRAVAAVLASTTLIGAALIGSAWWMVHGVENAVSARATSEPEPVAASLLSARRIPGVLSDDVRFGDFADRLESFASRLPEQSCFAVDVEGRRIASRSASGPLLPASNMKILVAAVALEVLGPDYRFTTELHGRVDNGVVTGDLGVIGGGDPVMQSEGYAQSVRYPNRNYTPTERIAEALREIGVTRVSGNIVADESRYDTERWVPTLGLGVRVSEVGPLGALMINDGSVLGDPLKPDDPAFAAAREIFRVLSVEGISVDGSVRSGAVERGSEPLAVIESATLREILVDLLSNSDNNAAELLLKEIGLVSSGAGTREGGIAKVRASLESRGLDTSTLTMVDGAGLDRSNRFSCDLVQALLVGDDGTLADGLAVAGRTGTLRELFIGNPMEGRLRGKTGTLTGAKALAGTVPYAEDRSIAYSLILNGPNVANQSFYRPLWNAMGEIFATLGPSPSVDEIAPFVE